MEDFAIQRFLELLEFPAACSDKIDKSHRVDTPPLRAGLVYSRREAD